MVICGDVGVLDARGGERYGDLVVSGPTCATQDPCPHRLLSKLSGRGVKSILFGANDASN